MKVGDLAASLPQTNSKKHKTNKSI